MATADGSETGNFELKNRLEREAHFCKQFCQYLVRLCHVGGEFDAGQTTAVQCGHVSKTAGVIGSGVGGAAGFALGTLAPPIAPVVAKAFSTTTSKGATLFGIAYETNKKRRENYKIFDAFPQDQINNRELNFMKLLVDAAVRIFRIFECQFSNVVTSSVDKSWKRAMAKLAEDAAQRVINCVKKLDDQSEIKKFCHSLSDLGTGSRSIFNAILKGPSSKDIFHRKGRTVLYNFSDNPKAVLEMKTTQLFDLTGYLTKDEQGDVLLHERLLPKISQGVKFGYRRLLMEWDNFYKENIHERKLYKECSSLSWHKSFVDFHYKLDLNEETVKERVHNLLDLPEFKEWRKPMTEELPQLITNVSDKIDDLTSVILKKQNNENGCNSRSHMCLLPSNGKEQRTNPGNLSEDLFLPINRIGDTKLFTGIFYKVTLKTFSQGEFMCVTEHSSDTEAKYVYMEKKLGESDVMFGSNYEFQWMFNETEEPGWYTLRNRLLPCKLTTWSYQGGLPNGHYIISSTKSADVERLGEGGEWRQDALWKPVTAPSIRDPLNNYLQIKMYAFPQGTVTWTGQDLTERFGGKTVTRTKVSYIQVSTNATYASWYEPGGQWYDDSLFTFQETPNQPIVATISDFQFSQDHSGQDENFLKPFIEPDHRMFLENCLISNKSDSEVTRMIEKPFEVTNTFSMIFNDRLEMFDQVQLEIYLPFLRAKVVKGQLSKWASGAEEKLCVQNNFKSEVKVAPHSSLNVRVYMDYVKGAVIPFNAKMTVTPATTNRLMKNGSEEIFKIPSIILQQILHEKGFNSKYISENVYQISGQITANFFTQPFMNIENV